MTANKPDKVVLMAPAARALCDEFIAWQCRIRQRSARNDDGRPSPGMRPRALAATGEELATAVTVLIHEADPRESTMLFRFQFLKTHDAAERHAKAIEVLAAGHFQQPSLFSDVMTALFGPQSALADRLLEQGRCILEFTEHGQAYRLPCAVAELAADDPFYQTTYWHNRLFNPNLPSGIRVLSFAPDWTHASKRTAG